MMMLTKENRQQLPPLLAQDGEGDNATVFVKYFAPWSFWTWYATEGEPIKDDAGKEIDFRFFGWVFGDFPELGYFHLSQLTEITGPMGLKIERDRYFDPQPLAKVKAYHNEQ